MKQCSIKSTFLLLVVIICVNISFAEVIFEDNFDSHADWELYQPLVSEILAYNAYPVDRGTPSILLDSWNMAYTSASYYSDKGHNNIILDSTNRRGSTGKGLTFWAESDKRAGSGGGWASDGQIGQYLGQEYQELYIQYWMKFSVPYYLFVGGGPGGQMKIIRVVNWKDTSLSPFAYFTNTGPAWIMDWVTYAGSSDPSISLSYRYQNVYFPDQAIPYHTRSEPFYFNGASYGGDLYEPEPNRLASHQFETPGNWGDGNWHRFDIHMKINSQVGIADGVLSVSIDGNTVADVTNLAWIDQGGTMSGWDFFTIGGNNNNYFANYSEEAEQWYAIDDVVVSTTPIPSDYVISGSPAIEESFNILDNNQNHYIDTNELLDIVKKWKRGELSMTETFNYLNKWKRRERV